MGEPLNLSWLKALSPFERSQVETTRLMWPDLLNVCESAPEHAFALALILELRERGIVVCAQNEWPMRAVFFGRYRLMTWAQFELDSYRLDFFFAIQPLEAGPNDPENWARLAVEIDGFEYHERTPDAGLRDRRRDRALAMMGIPTIRYMAVEVMANANLVVRECLQVCDTLALDRQCGFWIAPSAVTPAPNAAEQSQPEPAGVCGSPTQ